MTITASRLPNSTTRTVDQGLNTSALSRSLSLFLALSLSLSLTLSPPSLSLSSPVICLCLFFHLFLSNLYFFSTLSYFLFLVFINCPAVKIPGQLAFPSPAACYCHSTISGTDLPWREVGFQPTPRPSCFLPFFPSPSDSSASGLWVGRKVVRVAELAV